MSGKMSVFQNCFASSTTKPLKNISEKELFAEIKCEKHKKSILRIRSEPDEKKRRALKQELLSGVTISGEFAGKASEYFVKSSDRAMLDCDHLTDAQLESFPDMFRSNPFVRAFWLSPSGRGFKVLFKTRSFKDDSDYKMIYESLLREFYYWNLDVGTKDISRLTFFSYDPELYVNDAALVYQEKFLKEPTKAKGEKDPVLEQIKSKVTISELMREYGYDMSRNPTMCQLGHSSQGKACSGHYCDDKLFHCFNCGAGGDVFSFIMAHDRCDFKTAKGKLMQRIGLESQQESKEHSFMYATEHLPNFEDLRILSGLHGIEYTPILKGVYYSLCGVVLRDKKISLGDCRTDSRFSLTIPIPSGQGKKNIKICYSKIMKALEYDVHIPLSMHSQQLIGKIVNRGKPTKPNWIRNEGYLSRDVLLLDEAYKLFTSKDEEIQESRRAVRISKDCIGDNLVEKKQVDNLFTDEETLSYCPKVTIVQFLQDKKVPADVVDEGDLRRDLILYIRGIATRDKTDDFKNRLLAKDYDEQALDNFTSFLNNLNAIGGLKFSFDDKAFNRIVSLHASLIAQGFAHSQKGADFTNIVDMTLQDFLLRMSCIVSALYGSAIVSEAAVELAFMDLLEFFSMQLNFVKDKVSNFGNSWNGAVGKDQQVLEYLWNQGAKDEVTSTVSINSFKTAIGHIRGVSYDAATNSGQAVKVYDKFKREGWIDSRQVGQHDSRVWLAFTPALGNRIELEGSKGSKGFRAYSMIFSDLKAKISSLGSNNPNNPNNPEGVLINDAEVRDL